MLPAIMLVGPFWLRPCISIGGSGVTTTCRAPPFLGVPAAGAPAGGVPCAWAAPARSASAVPAKTARSFAEIIILSVSRAGAPGRVPPFGPEIRSAPPGVNRGEGGRPATVLKRLRASARKGGSSFHFALRAHDRPV